MGSDRCTRTTLVARCCYGAFFGFGFVLTVFTLAVMFWIAWCYFGLTIVQISDTQRRAIVNYSYSSTSKAAPSLTTSLPTRSTTLAPEETSINSIPKSTVAGSAASVPRGSGGARGESQLKFSKRKDKEVVVSSLAKGDFATRDRATHDSVNATAFPSKDVSSSVIPSPRGPPRGKEDVPPVTKEKASILTASSEEEDRVYARRVFPPGTENRPEDSKKEPADRNVRRKPGESEPNSRLDIAPTKVYEVDKTSESSRVEAPLDRPSRDDVRIPPRDYVDREKPELPRRDDIQSSRRTDPEPAYRDPDFDRDYPPRRYDRGKSRYDEEDDVDERGSRGRYDKRDRGRDGDDRYPKGDARVYPDDGDRYRARERYPDDVPTRRGDDDDRDYEERSRIRDRSRDRYRDRDLDEKSPARDDRYRDDDRYRPRDDDDRYRSREEDRYRSRTDDGYRPRDDERYRPRDDDKIRPRDDDRYVYRDDDRYRSRGDEDRYRSRDDDRYVEDRRDTAPLRPRDDRDDYSRPRVVTDVDSPTSRLRDKDYRESASRVGSSVPAERKPISSSRSEYDVRGDGTVTDYDTPARDRPRSYVRDDAGPSRLSRPTYDDVRDRDRDDGYRRPSRYEDDISPTKTRDDVGSYSRSSSMVDPRPKYPDGERERIRDDRYYEREDKIRGTRIQDSRGGSSEGPRRVVIDDDEKYRTRLPYEESKSGNRREEVFLDRRSYASEEDEEYRRRGAVRTDDDRDRRPLDDGRRRYRDDEDYPPRRRDPADDEDYKRSRTRDDYDDRDRVRSRDRYDDEYRRYDDDRYYSSPSAKGDKSPPVRKYDAAYPDEDERPPRRRDSEMRKEDPRGRDENLRPSSSSRDEERFYSRGEYSDAKPSPSTSSRRRYGDDDLSLSDSRDYPDDRKYPRQPPIPVSAKDYALGSSRTTSISSREPGDVVIREKRFQDSTGSNHQSSRVFADAVSANAESREPQVVRPLSAKDVIEAAIRHSDGADQSPRKVYYPVFDPRVSNLTSPEIIRPSERRGTTITAKKRRSVPMILVNV